MDLFFQVKVHGELLCWVGLEIFVVVGKLFIVLERKKVECLSDPRVIPNGKTRDKEDDYVG